MNAPERLMLPDIQSQPDNRNILIDGAGQGRALSVDNPLIRLNEPNDYNLVHDG